VHTGIERRSSEPDTEPKWVESEVTREPMGALELPLAFVAFARKQLGNANWFKGGDLALPKIKILAVDTLGTGLPGWLPRLALLRRFELLGFRLAVAIKMKRICYSIYDHLPANYILCSTPKGKLSEFGDF